MSAAYPVERPETHPAWCEQDDCDANGHLSRRFAAGKDGDLFGVDVALVALDLGSGQRCTAIELGVTEDGCRQSWLLSLDQGEDLASAVAMLSSRASQ